MANLLWQGDDATTPTTWTTIGNWDTGAIPIDGDSVYFRHNGIGVFLGLNQSAIQPALLDIASTYAGRIGGTAVNTNTAGSNYLQIGPVLCVIGEPSTSGTVGSGSGRIKLDYGADPVVTIVRSTGASGDTGLAPVRLKGGSTASKLYVQSGKVDVATEDPDETANLAEFSVTGTDAVLTLGEGVVWVTGYITAGTVNLNSKGTTLNQQAGTVTAKGANLIRAVTVGGDFYCNARFGVLSVTGITRVSTTATATVASTAALATGDTVYVEGAGQAGYNGFKTITVASGTTFTFTCASDDVTPATGTITAYKAIESLTITRNGHVHFEGDSRPVHVKTLTVHPDGQYTVNQANPTHLVIGTLAVSNAKNVKVS